MLKAAAKKNGACANPAEDPAEKMWVNIGAATPSPMARKLRTAPCSRRPQHAKKKKKNSTSHDASRRLKSGGSGGTVHGGKYK